MELSQGSGIRELSKRCRRKNERQTVDPREDLDLIPALDTDTAYKVLTFLPLLKLYHLRLVSKEWNAVLQSGPFLQTWSSAAQGGKEEEQGRSTWLVMVRKADDGAPFTRELIAHDSSSGGWVSLRPLLATCPDPALSTLGGPSIRSVANPFCSEYFQSFTEFMAVGGAPGLVCFFCSPFIDPPYITLKPLSDLKHEYCLADLAYDFNVFSLLVLNLITGSYDLLPPNPKHRYYLATWQRYHDFIHLTVQPLSHTPTPYCVFLQIDRADYPGVLEVYDSRSKAWKVGKPCCGPLEAKLGSAADLDKADLIQYKDDTASVFAYSVDLDEWSQLCVHPKIWRFSLDIMDFFPKGNTLLKHRGRLLLASIQGAPDSLAGFAVWELRMRPSPQAPIAVAPGTPTADWVEVARTPEKYWKGFYDIDKDNGYKKSVKLMSSGRLICMTSVHFTDSEYGGTYYPPLVYDLVHDSWYHLPPYKGGYEFSAAFCLQPSFTAMA